MQADCLVNYRRLPWQDADGKLRVTLDVGLESVRPAGRPVEHRHRAGAREPGPAGGRVEMARAGGEVARRAARLAARPAGRASSAAAGQFSKFETASQAVHGAPAGAA